MTKKRLLTVLIAFIVGFCIAGGVINNADAKVGFTNVGNESSRDIKIACDYNGPLIIIKPGRNSMDSGKCTKKRSDTDQIYTTTTQIMLFSGPVKKDGCYRMQPNIRRKLPDLSVATLYNLSSGCHGKTYHGYWGYS